MSSLPVRKPAWPWSVTLPEIGAADPAWPKISIVTPSYNQAAYLEETLLTVLAQGYPNLEYLVMEDGSTDGSPAIIERHRTRLAQYVAGPNRGFGAVLHDGLSRCTGEIMAWLNSDDLYLPGALETVGRIFHDCPDVDWIVGGSLICDPQGQAFAGNQPPGFSRKLFFSGRYLGGHPAWNGRWIPQESVFWRRRLWEKAGAHFIQERLQYGDFELWSRFWQHAELHSVPTLLGVYRVHAATYTSQRGTKSLEPCTRLIETEGQPTLSGWQIRWRDLLSRCGRRFTDRFGQPARAVEFNQQSGRWEPRTVKVH